MRLVATILCLFYFEAIFAQKENNLNQLTCKFLCDIAIFANADSPVYVFNSAYLVDLKADSAFYFGNKPYFKDKDIKEIIKKSEKLKQYEWTKRLFQNMEIVHKEFVDSIYKADILASDKVINKIYKKGFYTLSPIFFNDNNSCLFAIANNLGGGSLDLYRIDKETKKWKLAFKVAEWVY